MKIIGQERLLEKLNKYTIDTIPKTLMLIGENGCGKKTFTKMLADRLGLDLVVIDENVTADDLVEYGQSSVPKFYQIELMKFSEKQQNQFLKFIEEPAESVYIVILACSEIGVLPTILNRCFKLYFEPYKYEQLKEFSWMTGVEDELFFKICRTPGQLVSLNEKSYSALINLCTTVVNKIQSASYLNALKIVTDINCKEDYDKVDFELFFNTLEYLAFNDYIKNKNEISLTIYCVVNHYNKLKLNKRVDNKEAFLLSFIDKLWGELHP